MTKIARFHYRGFKLGPLVISWWRYPACTWGIRFGRGVLLSLGPLCIAYNY